MRTSECFKPFGKNTPFLQFGYDHPAWPVYSLPLPVSDTTVSLVAIQLTNVEYYEIPHEGSVI